MRPDYPFSAIVGNDVPKNAMVCALASPDITSVLICGPRGSGKTVLARSVTSLSGGREVVVLPLGATEDMIFGGIDVEATLKEGRRRAFKGILSRADGNIVLAENINLMPLSLIFQVMNAAESGSVVVERDGFSEVQKCRFLLIATMDAEEGAIPNHILDRFDICVFMSTSEDEDVRETVIGRRLLYESDPRGFVESYRSCDQAVEESILMARDRVRFTFVPEGYLAAISDVCGRLNVAGHRGDIAVMNASRTIAALDGRDSTNLDDLKKAAAMCLEHRRNDSDDHDEDSGTEHPSDGGSGDDSSDGDVEDGRGDGRSEQADGSADPDEESGQDAESDLPPPPVPESEEEVFSIGDVFKVIDYLPKGNQRLGMNNSGKHESTISSDSMGRCIGYAIPRSRIGDIALSASIRAAAPHQRTREHNGLAIVIGREDLREKVRERKQGNNILFLVDGSGSIGAQKRMIAVKGAILSMLRDAYQKRDSIGMAVFRTDRAEEVLPLTRSILKAYKVLSDIPTGGRTPLVHGLIKGHEILKGHLSDDSCPVMVIMSDGRCNVSFTQGMKPVEEMIATAKVLSGSGIRFIVIDTEVGRMRFGLAMDLCRALGGTYLRLEDLNAEYIESSVRAAISF